LEYETAKDKKASMGKTLENFELAIKNSDNPSYKNYYGYLLIDFNINVQRGLRLVLEALKQSPNNWAYMDSVAWGYFKLKRYDEAFNLMKKIVNNIGEKNEDIKLHWEKIQKANK
jgi:tetratricopeptide (TPR) repeat protein